MSARLWAAGVLLAAAGSGTSSCVTDHDALAKQNGRGGAGSGGVPSLGGSAGFPAVPGGAGSGGMGGRVPDEPRGEDVLTIVNGIVDAPSVRLCFRVSTEESARYVEAPAGAEELAYAASLVVREIDDVDFDAEALEPLVIAGELELVADLDCEEAVDSAAAEQAAAEPPEPGVGGAGGSGGAAGAGVGGEGGAFEPPPPPPPRLRTAALPILPAGTLTRGRSTLLAATGCIGGPAFTAADVELACGEEYSARTPTLSAVWVNLSRRAAAGKLGLQLVHASHATKETLSAQSMRTTASSEPAVPIVSSVPYGTIEPRVPRLELTAADYGANTQLFQLEMKGAEPETSSETWRAIRARAGIERLEDGRTYALVVVGPRMGRAATGYWNAPAVALVPTDGVTP